MNGITCVTYTQQLDETWTWVAYDRDGRRIYTQDRCDDLPAATEAALTTIAARPRPAVETKSPQPGPEAKRKPKRRSARK